MENPEKLEGSRLSLVTGAEKTNLVVEFILQQRKGLKPDCEKYVCVCLSPHYIPIAVTKSKELVAKYNTGFSFWVEELEECVTTFVYGGEYLEITQTRIPTLQDLANLLISNLTKEGERILIVNPQYHPEHGLKSLTLAGNRFYGFA